MTKLLGTVEEKPQGAGTLEIHLKILFIPMFTEIVLQHFFTHIFGKKKVNLTTFYLKKTLKNGEFL